MPKDPSAQVPVSPTPGIVLALLGIAVAGAAFLGATSARGSIAGLDARHAELALGTAIAVAGVALAIRAWTRPPPPVPSRRADEAFKSKADLSREVDAASVTPVRAAPAPPAGRRVVLTEPEALSVAIRDVKERIAKAKVQLGTGKLSKDGYAKLSKDLRIELGELEARRARLQLR